MFKPLLNAPKGPRQRYLANGPAAQLVVDEGQHLSGDVRITLLHRVQQLRDRATPPFYCGSQKSVRSIAAFGNAGGSTGFVHFQCAAGLDGRRRWKPTGGVNSALTLARV
jgi:hypothetical protein